MNPARHVGHMEQHPGAQEAAGLSAGEAAAAEERPDGPTTVRGYVHTGELGTVRAVDRDCFCYAASLEYLSDELLTF